MSTHKHIDRICCIVLALTLVVTLLFVNGEALGLQAASRTVGYENQLFDPSRVHTIDIVMDDWDDFIANCTNKEYAACSLVIDGEAYKNVGIRGKGSYSMRIASYGGNRYSFKVEFDHYDNAKTYHGLDKLALNNISMDNTYMKDYLAYRLMGQFGVAAPLCSYVYITVNGQDWGLYLAVEGVEDAFMRRNYGSDAGNLYKPDSSADFGGMGGAQNGGGEPEDWPEPITLSELIQKLPEDSSLAAALKAMPEGTTFWTMWEELPDDLDFSEAMEELSGIEELSEMFSRDRGGGRGGMDSDSSDDVKLKYIDDNPDSYANIFNNAKTKVGKADGERLIASIKSLNSGENIEQVVDVEQVIRYFVVHTFVCNGDSYTGGMVHNYYLREKDGMLSMIPWDYNLAFGDCFNYEATAGSVVNAPIDSPVTGDETGDRPMLAWIFNNKEYTERYHQYYRDFLAACATDGKLAALIDSTSVLISPYVEKDPTKSCTYTEYETAVSTLKEFCRLRIQSVSGQLEGSIPSTSKGQTANASALVDASAIDLSSMGAMVGGGWGNWDQDAGSSKASKSAEPFTRSADKRNLQTENTVQSGSGHEQKGDSHWRGNVDGAANQGWDRSTGTPTPDSKTSWGLVTISGIVLLVGILAAFRFKRG